MCLSVDHSDRRSAPVGDPSANGTGSSEYIQGMIQGAHVIIYSKDAAADRAFFRDVLNYKSVDAGHGWLIFALPPAELAVHPSDENDVHELFLMCDDVQAFIAAMEEKHVKCSFIGISA